MFAWDFLFCAYCILPGRSRANPERSGVNVLFLTDSEKGVGTKFRETRMMGKREAGTELEVTEYVPNERVRDT